VSSKYLDKRTAFRYAGLVPVSTPALSLKDTEEQQLRQWISAFGTPQQVALRSQIVLAAAEGKADSAIALQLAVNRKTVNLWRARFQQDGPDGLWEVAPGRGRKPVYGPDKIQAIVDATLRTKPKGMTQWSCRLLAAEQGVSKSTINSIWQGHNLKPHLTKTFKLSRDARFLEKLTDVVGLYLNPPQQAMVLCVDEKSQIQALDRTQPGLPLKKGRCGTMTHDYKRNGTTTLFAALEILQGRVVGQCYERHRHQEFLRFLRRLDQQFPGETWLHLVMDNYGTHKHPRVQTWLKRHPRFVPHFVPTSSSWLNLVERWFGELTRKRIRCGSFGSVADLQKAIEEFLTAWNENPKPFVWTATVESIVGKLSRCRQTLEQIQPGCTLPRQRKAKRKPRK
jgi:transposase